MIPIIYDECAARRAKILYLKTSALRPFDSYRETLSKHELLLVDWIKVFTPRFLQVKRISTDMNYYYTYGLFSQKTWVSAPARALGKSSSKTQWIPRRLVTGTKMGILCNAPEGHCLWQCVSLVIWKIRTITGCWSRGAFQPNKRMPLNPLFMRRKILSQDHFFFHPAGQVMLVLVDRSGNFQREPHAIISETYTLTYCHATRLTRRNKLSQPSRMTIEFSPNGHKLEEAEEVNPPVRYIHLKWGNRYDPDASSQGGYSGCFWRDKKRYSIPDCLDCERKERADELRTDCCSNQKPHELAFAFNIRLSWNEQKKLSIQEELPGASPSKMIEEPHKIWGTWEKLRLPNQPCCFFNQALTKNRLSFIFEVLVCPRSYTVYDQGTLWR